MQQGNLFNIEQGRAARDAGMQKAITHANAVHESWSERAYELLRRFLADNPGEFMAEDVRSHAAVIDFPLPPSARAWGSIFMKAAKEGLIERVRFGQVKNVKAHHANASVWIKNNKAA